MSVPNYLIIAFSRYICIMFLSRSNCVFAILACLLSLNVSAQWKKIYSGSINDLYDVRQYNNRVYACGQNSTLIFSADSGKTWKTLNIPIASNLRTLHFFDSLKGIVTGENARVLKTYDGGKTWTQKYARTAAYAYDMRFLGDSGILVGKDFLIASTSNGGETWRVDTTDQIRKELKSITISPEGRCWAVGDSGFLLNKHLTHNKWQTVKLPTKINLSSVVTFGESDIVICGGMPDTARVGKHFNILFYSQDTGKTWTSSSVSEMKTIYSASYFNKDTGFMVGSNGIVSKVYQPLAKRGQQISGVSSTLNRISCSYNVAIIVGDGGTVLRSTNRGGFGVNIEAISSAHPINLFPNPGNGSIQIESSETITQAELSDLNGRILQSNFDPTNGQLQTDYSGFAIIKITFENGNTTYRKVFFL